MKPWAEPLARPQEPQKLQLSAGLLAGEPQQSKPLRVLALLEPQATRPTLPKVRQPPPGEQATTLL